jgi:hypothetical protein
MRRILPVGAATALVVASAILSVPTSTQAVAAERAPAAKVKTQFAMKAAGYGTRIQGGALPAQSGTTGYQVIGCTNEAGLDRDNYVAEVDLPGLGAVRGIRTRVWTKTNRKQGMVSSYARHSVARVTLAQTALGSLELTGLESYARAWFDGKRFRTATDYNVAGIAFNIGGQKQEFDLPLPGQTLPIPGLAEISVGHSKTRTSKTSADAWSNTIRIRVIPTDTVIRVSHSAARISKGITRGIFQGNAYGARVDALDENIRVGKNPLKYIPCQGTQGKVQTKDVAGINLADQVKVGAVHTAVQGNQNRKRAKGWTEASVAGVNLGDGALVIDAVKARANVTRTGKRWIRNSKGTGILGITFQGQSVSLSQLEDLLESNPLSGLGLIDIKPNVVKKTANGIQVIGLQIVLLDGTGATIDLAQARLKIKSSGLK